VRRQEGEAVREIGSLERWSGRIEEALKRRRRE
jgi:hypothetical protein